MNRKYLNWLVIVAIAYLLVITWCIRDDFKIDATYENRPNVKFTLIPEK